MVLLNAVKHGFIFCIIILKKVKNEQKSLKTAEKKKFEQLSGARSIRKLVEIHNIRHCWEILSILQPKTVLIITYLHYVNSSMILNLITFFWSQIFDVIETAD